MRLSRKYKYGYASREIDLTDNSLEYRFTPIVGDGVQHLYNLCRNNPNRIYLWITYLTANNLSIWPEGLVRSDAVFAVPSGIEGFKVSVFNDFTLPTLEWNGQMGSSTGTVNVVEILRRK